MGWVPLPADEVGKPAGWRGKLAALLAVGTLPFMANGFYQGALLAVPAAFWASEVLLWVVLPLAVWHLTGRLGLATPRELGFSSGVGQGRHPRLRLLFLVLLAPLLLVPAYGLISNVGALIPQGPPPSSFNWWAAQPPRSATALWLAVLVFQSLSAGLVEELYYRSLLRRLIPSTWPVLAYMAISAALFGAVHWERGLVSVVRTTAFGLLAAGLYARWRNIWPLVAGHTAVDLVTLGG